MEIFFLILVFMDILTLVMFVLCISKRALRKNTIIDFVVSVFAAQVLFDFFIEKLNFILVIIFLMAMLYGVLFFFRRNAFSRNKDIIYISSFSVIFAYTVFLHEFIYTIR